MWTINLSRPPVRGDARRARSANKAGVADQAGITLVSATTCGTGDRSSSGAGQALIAGLRASNQRHELSTIYRDGANIGLVTLVALGAIHAVRACTPHDQSFIKIQRQIANQIRPSDPCCLADPGYPWSPWDLLTASVNTVTDRHEVTNLELQVRPASPADRCQRRCRAFPGDLYGDINECEGKRSMIFVSNDCIKT